MECVLKTNKLCKYYKSFKVLNDLTMNIPKGSIYGFVGKNGAGKTTLIRIISGLQMPTSGEYELYGIKNTNKSITNSRYRMGAVVETPALYNDMTAKDNIKQQYYTLGIPSFDDIEELLTLVGLKDTGNKKVKKFSLGMRQRLGIAMALCSNPDFLLLDEPINGLDPQGIIEIRELILKLNREKKITVLISSHILDELSRLATHYGFISDGHIIREMSAKELEDACRKRIRVTVTDTVMLAKILDDMNMEYKILDSKTADIYAKPNITKFVISLDKQGCQIESITEHDENLESFYMSLLGGGNYE